MFLEEWLIRMDDGSTIIIEPQYRPFPSEAEETLPTFSPSEEKAIYPYLNTMLSTETEHL